MFEVDGVLTLNLVTSVNEDVGTYNMVLEVHDVEYDIKYYEPFVAEILPCTVTSIVLSDV